jgi:hypothetical protein
MSGAAVVESLELAAERIGDPGPEIFIRLFARHPEFERLFVMDTDGSVRGSMIDTVIDCVLGKVEGRGSAAGILHAERERHPGYGVPQAEFGVVFSLMRDVVRDGLGKEWTPVMEQGWTEVLRELDPAG